MSGQDDFPAAVKGHTYDDFEDTLVMGVHLHRLKRDSTAFPSIPLFENDDLDARAASNGRYLYLWSKRNKTLFTVSLEDIVKSARFHLTGKIDKPAEARRIKVTCAKCRESDVEVFEGDERNAVGRNGWRFHDGVTLCPDCVGQGV